MRCFSCVVARLAPVNPARHLAGRRVARAAVRGQQGPGVKATPRVHAHARVGRGSVGQQHVDR
eukprot:4953530-Alexandrium_andersonii.AAC.1